MIMVQLIRINEIKIVHLTLEPVGIDENETQ